MGVSILILLDYLFLFGGQLGDGGLKIEVSILILLDYLFLSVTSESFYKDRLESQSLFYWITYSYTGGKLNCPMITRTGLNPYFIGLPILITKRISNLRDASVSILILLDYLFLLSKNGFFLITS